MIERLNPFVLSKESQENMELAEWIWQSHYWIEFRSGYYECKWCHKTHTSSMGISKDAPLCEKNPAVIKVS